MTWGSLGVVNHGIGLHLDISCKYYAMVGSIPHTIAFGMCHVKCKGISHNHMVSFLAIAMLFTAENFNLGYLKVKNE